MPATKTRGRGRSRCQSQAAGAQATPEPVHDPVARRPRRGPARWRKGRAAASRQLDGHRADAAAVGLVVIGVLCALGLWTDLAGPVGSALADGTGALLGRARVAIPVACIAFAVLLLWPRRASAAATTLRIWRHEAGRARPNGRWCGSGSAPRSCFVADVAILHLAYGQPALDGSLDALRNAGGVFGAADRHPGDRRHRRGRRRRHLRRARAPRCAARARPLDPGGGRRRRHRHPPRRDSSPAPAWASTPSAPRPPTPRAEPAFEPLLEDLPEPEPESSPSRSSPSRSPSPCTNRSGWSRPRRPSDITTSVGARRADGDRPRRRRAGTRRRLEAAARSPC